MLCAICISMFQGPSKQGDHHASFENLIKAAQSGCKICKSILMFREELGADEVGEQSVEPFITFSIGNFDEPTIEFSASVSWLGDSMPFKEIQFHVSAPQPTPRWWIHFLEDASSDLLDEAWRVRVDRFPSRQIPCNTGDVEVSRLALEWLNTCRSHHLTCDVVDETRESNFFPLRLLKISKREPPACHLLIPGDGGQVKEDIRYVALSHCWGRNPSVLTLTIDNMDRMKDNIPLCDLPKSFLEAIQACQRLGFQYIWIDSLCIIQSGPGSGEDWQRHAGLMDLIYANCELNIAVAHASDSTQGCFVDRNPDFIQTAYVYAPIAMGLDILTMDPSDDDSSDEAEPREDSSDLNFLSNLVTIFAGDHDFVSSLVNKHPLQKRAWVFQERLMAPRALHFGKDRIFWECKEKKLNEYLPWGLPPTGATFSTHGALPFSLPDELLRSEPIPRPDQATIHFLGNRWQLFVGYYSETDLTYPEKDKLIAICAIAKKFGRVLPGPYTAGLFLSADSIGLLWVNTYGLKYIRRSVDGWKEEITLDNTRDLVYRAPSWSWASVEGRTSWPSWTKNRHVFAEIKSISVELVEPSNPYGQLSSAEIIVDGPISSIQPLREQDLVIQSNSKSPETFSENDGLFALYFFKWKNSQMGDFDSIAYGLVLTRVNAETYRRVGQICLTVPDGTELEFHKMDRVMIV